jgi:hypothetical protein
MDNPMHVPNVATPLPLFGFESVVRGDYAGSKKFGRSTFEEDQIPHVHLCPKLPACLSIDLRTGRPIVYFGQLVLNDRPAGTLAEVSKLIPPNGNDVISPPVLPEFVSSPRS